MATSRRMNLTTPDHTSSDANMTRSSGSDILTHGAGRRWPLVVFVLFCLSLFIESPVRAQTAVFQAAGGPGLQVFRASGLDLQFNTDWVEGPGYIPIRITARQVGPARADRRITVELEHMVRRDRRTVVTQQIDVPPPPQSTTVRVPVPKWVSDYSGQYELNVYENGRRLKKLSGQYLAMRATSGVSAFNELAPKILFIDEAMPDSSTLGMMFPDRYAGTSGTGTPLSTSRTLKRADLLGEWIDYSCFDLVVVSREQLALLVTEQSEAWTAIRRWVLSGGNIVVHGYAADWSEIEEIDDVLADVSPSDESDKAADNGWRTTANRKVLRPIDNEALDDDYDQRIWQMGNDPFNSGRVGAYRDSSAQAKKRDKISPADAERRAREDATAAHVRSRRAGLGYVVAIAEEDLFPGERAIWRVVLNTLDSTDARGRNDDDRWRWHQRHGVSMLQENSTFWEFLVPGVGHALVTEFQVLISLFVVLIGPLNYWLLRRRRKLHLIVFTTPASAAVVTIALMTWGLVADGLATRARARTYTYLDQRDGTAVCWSRLSYYAGIAPAGGLVFPRDVAVIPIRVANAESNSIIWSTRWDNMQRLESGWLPSRTPTQFLTIRSRSTAAGLGVVVGPETDGSEDKPSITVTNRLGTRVDRLIIADADGRLFAITDSLSPGKVRTLSELDAEGQKTAVGQLRQSLAEFRPSKPEGLTIDTSNVYGQSQRWYGYGESGDTVSADSSRLERGYAAVEKALATSPPALDPRTYIAVVERSPEVVFGTDQAEEEASTHLIMGVW